MRSRCLVTGLIAQLEIRGSVEGRPAELVVR